MTAREFPSVELDASPEAMVALAEDVVGYAVIPIGDRLMAVWLQGRSGQYWLIDVAQRDLEFKFEVFTLAIEGIEELQARWEKWQPPSLPADIPEMIRRLVNTRPPKPEPPDTFAPWPFARWRTQVLRRVEYVIGDPSIGATFGDNPMAQDAVRPGAVPSDAIAFCEVAVGLLFSSKEGQRLLIGVDWMPLDLTVTEADNKIDEYVESCELTSLENYSARLRPSN